MKRVKIGIIGAGNISRSHMHGYQQLPNVDVVAVCDINEERAKSYAQEYGIPSFYSNLDEMLKNEELDGVSVCTWNNGHAPCSIAALKAGVNVLCEKPLAMNAQEAEEMVKTAKEAGKLLMVGFVRRFGENTRLLKQLIDQGELGDIYYAKTSCVRRCGNPGGWFSDKKRSGGGPLIDLGVHMIDLVRYLVGKPKAVAVTGYTFDKLGSRSNVKGIDWYKSADYSDYNDVEDAAVGLVRFDNGTTLFVETSWTQHIKEEKLTLELYGSKAGATMEPKLEIFGEKNDYIFNYAPVLNPDKSGFQSNFAREIAHFVDCIANGNTCLNPAEDGLELMKILDAIYRSAELGKEVIID